MVPKSSATTTRVFRRGQGPRGQRNEVLSGRGWGFASTNPHCNCHFYSRTETLVFDERGAIQFLVPDLILSTPLKEDDNNDLTFEETWAISDHWFQSNNSAPPSIGAVSTLY